MKLKIETLIILCTISFTAVYGQVRKITPKDETRAQNLVSQMTLKEKIDYIGGENGFYIRAIPRLHIPEIRMADGPQGVRNDCKSTSYPCGILTAATWNRDMAAKIGNGIARDAKARGVHFMLGPGVNIYRSPLCGRNFEYYGEDPYLTGEMAKSYIEAMQKDGVVPVIKHFVANNQEWDRNRVSSDVDERTLNEIYFPAFRKAVQEGGVMAIMNSYNLLNGVHATENKWLNVDVLREQWGFKGLLMSDWGAVHSSIPTANNGLDLEMPSGTFLNRDVLISAIENGTVSEKSIDTKVQHILQVLSAMGMLDKVQKDSTIALDNDKSDKDALDVAREGIVLLKNEDNTLPLKGRIAVLGPNADVVSTGGGSGAVTPYRAVTNWDGIRKIFGKRAYLIGSEKWYHNEVSDFYTDSSFKEKGFKAEYFNNAELKGEPSAVRMEKAIDYIWFHQPCEKINEDNFSVRWTAVYRPRENRLLNIRMASDDGCRVFINNELLIDDWADHSLSLNEKTYHVEAGKVYNIRVEYYDRTSVGEAKALFRVIDTSSLGKCLEGADHVVVCIGNDDAIEGEGHDRSFSLPKWQNELVNSVAKVNPNVIVTLNAGGGVDFSSWVKAAKAILMEWYPGQEGGRAMAEILSGKVNPSGKLPISIERRAEDNPSYNTYHATENEAYKRIGYKEGVFMGYRGYDKMGVKPLFPFGYGLSYTKYVYSNLIINKVDGQKVKVSFDIKNIGRYDGAEVAQIYVHDVVSSVPRPYKELKGYSKVFLKSNEQKHVTIDLDAESFSYYDTDSHHFIVEPGTFDILVGPSSADTPLKGRIDL